MSWPALLVALLVCHVVGDFLLQTEWQARNKLFGLARRGDARRALLTHVGSYTLAFAPALVWLGRDRGAGIAVAAAAAIALPHVLIDDGRPVRSWLAAVKHAPEPGELLLFAVDQSMHVVCLWAVSLLAGA